MPELGEPRVHVDIRLAADALQKRRQRDVAADVHQQFRAFGDFQEPWQGRSDAPFTATADQHRALAESEPPCHYAEPLGIDRLLEARDLPGRINAGLRRDLLDEIDVESKPP